MQALRDVLPSPRARNSQPPHAHCCAPAAPELTSLAEARASPDLNVALDGWTRSRPQVERAGHLVRRIGRHPRSVEGDRLLFHDTRDRAATDETMKAACDLSPCDGALASASATRDLYPELGWGATGLDPARGRRRAALHADGRGPHGRPRVDGQLGHRERAAEIRRFVLDPVRQLERKACVHGVRSPEPALATLRATDADVSGGFPTTRPPKSLLAPSHGFTCHGVRGLRRCRVFRRSRLEALAGGIALVSGKDTDESIRLAAVAMRRTSSCADVLAKKVGVARGSRSNPSPHLCSDGLELGEPTRRGGARPQRAPQNRGALANRRAS